jgi:ABC-type uncharacterized transport system auxiliary subunit
MSETENEERVRMMMISSASVRPVAKRLSIVAAAVIACALAAACSSRPPETRAYLLGDAPVRPAEPARDLPALRVKPLAARSFLDTNEIAWRQGDVLAGTYRYHRWSEPPAEMATRALVLALRDGGRFASVDGTTSRAAAPLVLSGELLGLHEVAEADGSRPRGVVELEVTLEAEAGAGVPARHWTIDVSRSVDAADGSVDALVRAVSEAAAQAIDALAREIEAAAASARN